MTTSDDDVVMPFGKYRGRSVIEVMAIDPQYVEWLKTQDWFTVKFVRIYNIVVQAGRPPEDTPEHNAIQVRFLDDEFCKMVAAKVIPPLDALREKLIEANISERELFLSSYDDTYKRVQQAVASAQHQVTVARSYKDDEARALKQLESNQLKLKDLPREREWAQSQLKTLPDAQLEVTIENRDMEDGVDVAFDIVTAVSLRSYRFTIAIEIKPSLGDDYPTVLRQMKEQVRRRFRISHHIAWFHHLKTGHRHVLCYGEFAARGATIDQVKTIFRQAGFDVVCVS
jgi:hypothetical protein